MERTRLRVDRYRGVTRMGLVHLLGQFVGLQPVLRCARSFEARNQKDVAVDRANPSVSIWSTARRSLPRPFMEKLPSGAMRCSPIRESKPLHRVFKPS